MRDVTPPVGPSHLPEIFNYLKNFVRHPMTEIQRLPNWNWPQVLTLQLILSLISGVLAALTDFSTWKLAQGILLFPIIATLMGLILSSFLYYYFQVFERRTVSFIKLATMVFIANSVFYLFHIAAGYLVVADIIGMAFTGMLLIIGLTENFQMDKKRSLRLIVLMFSIILIIWAFEKLRDSRLVRSVDTGSLDQSF